MNSRKTVMKPQEEDKPKSKRTVYFAIIAAFVAVITGIIATMMIIINMIINPSIQSSSPTTEQKSN